MATKLEQLEYFAVQFLEKCRYDALSQSYVDSVGGSQKQLLKNAKDRLADFVYLCRTRIGYDDLEASVSEKKGKKLKVVLKCKFFTKHLGHREIFTREYTINV